MFVKSSTGLQKVPDFSRFVRKASCVIESFPSVLFPNLCGLLGRAKRRRLNAADCEALSTNAEGVSALTLPHTVQHRQSRYNPHRGPDPRTPNKQQKYGNLL